MRATLIPHPDAPSRAIASIEADVERPWKHALKITYRLRGDLSAIRFPARAEPKHVDGLWRTTCFEAFFRDVGGKGYCEVNFSPSTEYAIYEFTDYREGMAGGYCSRAEIDAIARGDCFEMSAGVNFQRAGSVRGEGSLLVGLSAVIEETGGVKSYWALKHPPGKPDFHHAGGFALEI